MNAEEHFSADFRALNRDGESDPPPPLKWQTRLFADFCNNSVPNICDLPTGMGKTSIIHLWVLALRHQIAMGLTRLPTRLVYVVDRRTVVDQATSIAERISQNLTNLDLPKDWLSVSTLRGQFADNRDWTRDPSRPAIIIGTVDMIGSRLLFSGYRSSYKQRPLDAGMLGQDTLLVLDEAHLSAPFEKLIRTLGDQGSLQMAQGKPMRVMRMSATVSEDSNSVEIPFRLVDSDREGEPTTNPIIERYTARKRLFFHAVDRAKIRDEIVRQAISLAEDNSRVVVFVQNPDDAGKIKASIEKKLKVTEAVEVLTGTIRGLERDELLHKPVLKRFLDGKEQPSDKAHKAPSVLVSTSAGEVGFDLNADHLVCDAAPLDSMIQRLGRVNRRGYGDAEVHVFVADGEDTGKAKMGKASKWEDATKAAIACLKQLEKHDDFAFDASPRAVDELKARLGQETLQKALSPKPECVELTDILLDAWSMTTIIGPMPGRPPVAPWLRGLTDDQPQTTIAWRAELDVEGFDQLDMDDLEEWFDAHRILPHESVTVPTTAAQKWIRERWQQFTETDRDRYGAKPCIVDRAGMDVMSVRALAEGVEKRADSIRGGDIILPASFGGIRRTEGLLQKDQPHPVVADSQKISDVADERGDRFRLLRSGDAEEPLIGSILTVVGGVSRFTLELPGAGDTIRQLVSLVPKRQRPEYGTNEQSLKCHVGLVEKYASEIGLQLQLPGSVGEALKLAASWHDHGKDRRRWQDAAGRQPGQDPLGKSGGSMGRIAGGYRHEFGSLREFAEEHDGKISPEVFDLAMHLIAAHHGRARPHFPKGGFDPDAPAKGPQLAVDSLRRFARMQRRYGYWQLAWFENLLRCADAMASAHQGEQV